MNEEMIGNFLRQVEKVLKICWDELDFVDYFVVFLVTSVFSLINAMITFFQ
jgi:hypothetical protein